MGLKLSKFVHEQLAAGLVTAEEAELEERINASLTVWLADLRRARCGRGQERDGKRWGAESESKLLPKAPNPVVSDETVEFWRSVREVDEPKVKAYVVRALQVPLTVEDMHISFVHPARSYDMPVVRAHERPTEHEEEALAKFQVLRKHYPHRGKGVHARTEEVPEDVRNKVPSCPNHRPWCRVHACSFT